ncbi:cadmium resistance transporter [Geminocystis sp. NIES-3708]|uniref:cadmium resistance transporter n=1 Tax=Geminocystis sp. NIES-3708 TaxID=1615909 RepID=UPI0005FC900E|nr:cadmium resistance transporter [Geminocystis sp. NIES-3708]BAQ62472.1 cadmium resistance transporter [Geminocystis sp. NIES-3708]
MNTWLISTLITSVAVAFATTFDDNIYLTIFFGKINRTFRPRHIVIGEYLGFTLLVLISLVGFLGGLVISHLWIGLLGFLPISIGIANLLNRQEDEIQDVNTNFYNYTRPTPKRSLIATIRDPQTYKVSAVTVANGGNNIAIYIPLFASASLPSLGIILAVLYTIIGIWCFLSYNLTRQPHLAIIISRYLKRFFPFVLIWLGMSIIIDNQSYELFTSLPLFSW